MDTWGVKRPVIWGFIACAILFSVVRISEAVVIEKDTIWRGQLHFNEEVVVSSGVTLLVEPGTTVSFVRTDPPSALKIQGKIIAQGTVSEPIIFSSGEKDSQPGDWQGIVLSDSKEEVNRIRNAHVSFAVSGLQGERARLVLEDSVFENNLTGLSSLQGLSGGAYGCRFTNNLIGCEWSKSSDFHLKRSFIEKNTEVGLRCNLQSAPNVMDNIIRGNAQAGISCDKNASPSIRNNLITENRRGIYVQKKGSPEIAKNDLIGNKIGIWTERRGIPKIFENRILENEIGVFCDLYSIPLLRGNHIETNHQFSIALGEDQSQVVDQLFSPGGPKRSRDKNQYLDKKKKAFLEKAEDIQIERGKIDARENWWGTAVTEAMMSAGDQADLEIFQDAFDKPDVLFLDHPFPRDEIAYAPWREEPVDGVGRQVAPESGIEGQVLLNGRPLKGARVHVFRSSQQGFQGEGFSFSAPTDEAGRFSLHLAPGEYYLTARKTAAKFPEAMPSTNDLLGDLSENPVKIGHGKSKEVQISVDVLK